jgi:2-polyprenyl-3-methyl-5-hydroxy-6-metoxy-1,4-benzoquinol methylase
VVEALSSGRWIPSRERRSMTDASRDLRAGRIATLANEYAYDQDGSSKYIDGAPHIKHASLRELYARLLVRVFDSAARSAKTPRVLDLGAGDGSVTLPFLDLGAEVVAVDLSNFQLETLRKRCAAYHSRLESRCEDVLSFVQHETRRFDVVVLNSFLHHVPNYLGLLTDVLALLKPHGQLFSFQDPVRYDTIGIGGRMFTNMAYFSWRVLKGDVIGGAARRIRRAFGIYLDDSVHDNAEYHVTRKGVDQDAIAALLIEAGFQVTVVKYFSTQSRFFQPIGDRLGVENTFGVIATREPDARGLSSASSGP